MSNLKDVLLNGEKLENVVENVGFTRRGWEHYTINGTLHVTNYRLLFTYFERGQNEISLPLGTIYKSETIRDKKSKILSIECRDFRIENFHFTSAQQNSLKKVKNYVKDRTKKSSKTYKDFFALDHFCKENADEERKYWALGDFLAEYKRLGLQLETQNDSRFRVTTKNKRYAFSTTYPKLIVVPKDFREDDMYSLGEYRLKARIPFLAWIAPSGATLWRCSQETPFVGTDLTGASNDFSPKSDLYLLDTIRKITPSDKLFVVTLFCTDANDQRRHLTQAKYQTLSLQDTPKVKACFISLRQLCISEAIPESCSKWQQQIETTRWIDQEHTIFTAATFVIAKIMEEQSVIVQSDYGMDATTQVVSLVELLLDPTYRSFLGFGRLVEKEWLRMGQQFREDIYKPLWIKPRKAHTDPWAVVWIQWLNCVWSVMLQYPTAFQITEELLLFLVDSVTSGRFGTFLFTTEKSREEERATERTPSIWLFLDKNLHLFANPFYKPISGPLHFNTDQKDFLGIWNALLLRHTSHSRIRRAEIAVENCDKNSCSLAELMLPVLPSKLKHQLSLKQLDLSSNMFSFIPLDLLQLTNLTSLKMTRNNIHFIASDLPPVWATQWRFLRVLDLSHNFLRSLPSGLSLLSCLQELYAQGNRLVELLPNNEWKNLTQLCVLDVSHNQLPATLPTELVYNLTNLTFFGYGCKLTELSMWIARLKQLRELRLPSNQLIRLPSTICRLTLVEVLDLSNNLLDLFPLDILEMSRLKYLNLQSNRIQYIPVDIAELTNLEELCLRSNQLPEITRGIGALEKLTILDVSFNNLTTLPPNIGSLQLKQLTVEGNPLKTITKDLIVKGSAAILDNLKTAFSQPLPCLKASLMVLGPKKSGKTSVLKLLVDYCSSFLAVGGLVVNSGSLFESNSDISKTKSGEGITRQSFTISKIIDGKKTPIEFEAWEFSGESSFRLPIPYFFKNRAIYLLLYNCTQIEEGESELRYWLSMISARLHPSPAVIILGTHHDLAPTNVEPTRVVRTIIDEWKDKIPIISHVLEVSTAATTESLHKEISGVISLIPKLFEGIPSPVMELKSLLEQEKSRLQIPMITQSDFKYMGFICRIKDNTEALKILHETGSLMHFDDGDLTNVVITDSSWLAKLISTLFCGDTEITNNGIIKLDVLRKLWDTNFFPANQRSTLVNLLIDLDLAYCSEDNLIFLSEEGSVKRPRVQSSRKKTLTNSKTSKSTSSRTLGIKPTLIGSVRLGSSFKIFVPFLFPASVESQRRLEQTWNLVSANNMVDTITYTFGTFPIAKSGFFARLLVRLFQAFDSIADYWRYGVIVKHANVCALIECNKTESDRSQGSTLFASIVRSESSSIDRLVEESISSLLNSWYRVNFTKQQTGAFMKTSRPRKEVLEQMGVRTRPGKWNQAVGISFRLEPPKSSIRSRTSQPYLFDEKPSGKSAVDLQGSSPTKRARPQKNGAGQDAPTELTESKGSPKARANGPPTIVESGLIDVPSRWSRTFPAGITLANMKISAFRTDSLGQEENPVQEENRLVSPKNLLATKRRDSEAVVVEKTNQNESS